jgi:pantoate--beta-alanine ligase
MEVLTSVEAVRSFVASRRPGAVALVPTMGYLHEGHLALIREASCHAPTVIASIFVNPTQFGPNEDLSRYPRDTEGDLSKCVAAGCSAVFLPSVGTMYPSGHRTTVSVRELSAPLCGAHRPGHFDGVCTVVLKLLNVVGCDVAVFGEKDYQQLAVIRRMVRDLDVPVRIVGHPTVREPDGLAMSSRNVFLSAEERERARSLHRALAEARAAWTAGERDARRLERVARGRIETAAGDGIEYVELRDADTLATVDDRANAPVVLAVAVRYGRTRLIDNVVLR